MIIITKFIFIFTYQATNLGFWMLEYLRDILNAWVSSCTLFSRRVMRAARDRSVNALSKASFVLFIMKSLLFIAADSIVYSTHPSKLIEQSGSVMNVCLHACVRVYNCYLSYAKNIYCRSIRVQLNFNDRSIWARTSLIYDVYKT